MSKTDFQTPKGFRDFEPNEAQKRQFIIDRLTAVYKSYGFLPLQTPAVEFAETLKNKYGEEEKLIYEFEDRGGRNLALRYDLTVPLARFLAQNPQIAFPFKRYQIGPCWRAENPQKGRFREFWQADIDIVGPTSCLSDAEIAACAIDCAKALGLSDFTLYVNDRLFLQNTYDEIIKPTQKGKDFGKTSFSGFATAVDKLEKIGEAGVVSELIGKGLSKKSASEAISYLKNLTESEGKTENLKKFFDLARNFEIEEYCETDPTLARGLDYYTGLIFELKVKGYGGGTIAGGGRYDTLIGKFTGRETGAVGISFGINRLLEVAEEQNIRIPEEQVRVLVTVFDEAYQKQSQKVARVLRQNNISCELYLENAKLERQLKYALEKKIPYLAIIGPQEVRDDTITLKNLISQKQEKVNLSDLIKILQEN